MSGATHKIRSPTLGERMGERDLGTKGTASGNLKGNKLFNQVIAVWPPIHPMQPDELLRDKSSFREYFSPQTCNLDKTPGDHMPWSFLVLYQGLGSKGPSDPHPCLR